MRERKIIMTLEEILSDLKTDRRKKVIIDSDTYNEMDDQYAIAYALGSDKFNIVALNAAPFLNFRSVSYEDGMEKSYGEILRVLDRTGKTGICPVFKGSTERISDRPDLSPVDSPAARNLIEMAMSSDEIIYVLCLGAITNVSSAILMEPAIKEKICVVWLGGHCLEYHDLGEFNLANDYKAGQILLNSGVNLILLPAVGDPGHGTVALVTDREGMMQIKGDSDACVFFRETLPDELNEDYRKEGWSRVIWDIAAPAVINAFDAFDFSIIPAPVFADNSTYAFDSTRHKIVYMNKLDPKRVFADAFACISTL